MLGRVGVRPGDGGGCVFWFGEDDEQTLLGKLFEVDRVSDGSLLVFFFYFIELVSLSICSFVSSNFLSIKSATNILSAAVFL